MFEPMYTVLQTGFPGFHPCLCFDCETKKSFFAAGRWPLVDSHGLLLSSHQRSELLRWSLADVPGLTGNVASTWRPAHVERVER